MRIADSGRRCLEHFGAALKPRIGFLVILLYFLRNLFRNIFLEFLLALLNLIFGNITTSKVQDVLLEIVSPGLPALAVFVVFLLKQELKLLAPESCFHSWLVVVGQINLNVTDVKCLLVQRSFLLDDIILCLVVSKQFLLRFNFICDIAELVAYLKAL